MATCRSCGAPITWALTPAGKRTPIDNASTDGGNIELVGGVARVLAPLDAEAARLAGVALFVSHFATCPAAAAHRKGKGG